MVTIRCSLNLPNSKEKEKQIKTISYLLAAFAAVFTIAVGILSMDAFSLGAVGLLVLAVSPYLYGMVLTKLVSKRKAIVSVALLVSVVVIGGIALLIDAMYIHTDPQSALVFVVIPVYQWALLLLATLPVYLLNKKGKI